jgi:membrane protein DedA with SNARE-associated domain
MEQMEQFSSWLQQLSPAGVLCLMFFIAYIENIFPPSPSDVLLVFVGTLIGIGTIGFLPSLLSATAGSTLGFMTAYVLGRYFEQHVVSGKLGRFFPVGAIHQIEGLFRRYGYGVIVANRFLAGTRGIVSFFAGMSKMNLTVTTVLCALSATVWNSLLLYLGMIFAKNWRSVAEYLKIYSTVVTIAVSCIAIIFLLIYFRRRRNATRRPVIND